MVSNKGLTKFKELYLKHYGIELTDKEVFQKANNLLNFYRAIFEEPAYININHEQKIQSKEN